MDQFKLERAKWYESVVTSTICQKAWGKYGASPRSFLRLECNNFGIKAEELTNQNLTITNQELAKRLQVKAREYVREWRQDQLGQNGRLRGPAEREQHEPREPVKQTSELCPRALKHFNLGHNGNWTLDGDLLRRTTPRPTDDKVWDSRKNRDPYTGMTRDELKGLADEHKQAEFAKFACDHIFEVQLANMCFNLALYDDGPSTAPQPWHSTVDPTWTHQVVGLYQPFSVMLNNEANLCMTVNKINLNKKDHVRRYKKLYSNGISHCGDSLQKEVTYYLHQRNSELYRSMGLVLPQVAKNILFELNKVGMSLVKACEQPIRDGPAGIDDLYSKLAWQIHSMLHHMGLDDVSFG